VKRAILLVDHGSLRAEANQNVVAVARLVQEQVGPEVVVLACHMSLAEPTVEQGIARCAEYEVEQITVHPFMLAEGRHVREDIPRMVQEISKQYPAISFSITAPLGSHPLLAALVLERCQECLEK
jgi:sirohydrochlorin ferrochelatase